MVKIEWNDLPLALRDHLFDRAAERKITADDLYRLKLWRESEPNAPEGPWFKDFGSSRSVAKDDIRRHCFFAVSPQKEKRSHDLTEGLWQNKP
jgi:hypothetical protein